MTTPWTRKLRMGMVGGGQGAFIGGVHRIAAAMDGQIDLVAGVFSRDWSNTQTTGRQLYLDPSRVYRTADEMAAAEAKRAASDRIDFVSIVTPNDAHFGPAKAFLEAGIHVVCDKPVTRTLDEAEALARIVERSGCVFALTHNYTGYPLVRHARQLFQSGEMGVVRKVIVEYLQDWLMEPLEKQGSKQAAWRTDPAQSGLGGALGDIGTHALNLVEFVTGDRVDGICADLTTFLPDRTLDEDVNALLRMRGGGRGVLTVSQIATGEENALRLRAYASKGAIVWSQENP
ncbi:MAG TPA: Gfo/Idh/MocA family oxidoreductase, partial [Vicinamibacterales bacterium]|nr:Gfo/Idh/MocA family oxidoreductase [Vicinamibacterales bacterium]